MFGEFPFLIASLADSIPTRILFTATGSMATAGCITPARCILTDNLFSIVLLCKDYLTLLLPVLTCLLIRSIVKQIRRIHSSMRTVMMPMQ